MINISENRGKQASSQIMCFPVKHCCVYICFVAVRDVCYFRFTEVKWFFKYVWRSAVVSEQKSEVEDWKGENRFVLTLINGVQKTADLCKCQRLSFRSVMCRKLYTWKNFPKKPKCLGNVSAISISLQKTLFCKIFEKFML